MKLTWWREIPAWLLMAGMFVLAAVTWPSAPDRMAVHWNLAMEPNRYGGKAEGLLGLPLTAVVLYGLFLVLPRIDPGRANYAAFRGAYATLRTSVIAFLATLYAVIVLESRNVAVDMGAVLPIAAGAMLVVLGNVLGKLRPNWFVGIRTPWTLSSKSSWVRTHQAGAWVFVGAGIAFMAAGVIRHGWAMLVAIILMGAGALALIVYSFVVWRDDPDKVPPAGTLPA